MRTSYAQGQPAEAVRDGYRVIRRAGRYMVFPRAAFAEITRPHRPPRRARRDLERHAVPHPGVGPGPAGRLAAPRARRDVEHDARPTRSGPLGDTARAPGRAAALPRAADRHAVGVVEARARRRAGLPTPSGSTVVPPGIDPRFTPGGERSRPSRSSSPSAGSCPVKRYDLLVARGPPRPPAGPRPRAASSSARATSGHGSRRVIRELDAERLGHAAPATSPTTSWSTCTAGRGSSPSASAREGWGMTLTEAAACGTPAVATRIAGHADAVRDGRSGLLADDDAAEPRRRHGPGARRPTALAGPARRRRARRGPASSRGRTRRRPHAGARRRGGAAPLASMRTRSPGWRRRSATGGRCSPPSRPRRRPPRRPGRAGRRPARRGARPGPAAPPARGLGVVAYVPLLLTQRGQVGADTKTYLYLDPASCMSRAWSMWDPTIGLGTVTHQNIGYLWPMGPCYWAARHARGARLGRPAPLAGHDHVRRRRRGRVPAAHARAGDGAGVAGGRVRLHAARPYVLTLAARISVHPAAVGRAAVARSRSPSARLRRRRLALPRPVRARRARPSAASTPPRSLLVGVGAGAVAGPRGVGGRARSSLRDRARRRRRASAC